MAETPIPTDGFDTGPRPDILDPSQQQKIRTPGLDPTATTSGPDAPGHIANGKWEPDPANPSKGISVEPPTPKV